MVFRLTQDGERYPEQEHGHSSQHWHEQVTGQKDGQHRHWRVVSTETADGGLVLRRPDEAQEQQGDHCRPD